MVKTTNGKLQIKQVLAERLKFSGYNPRTASHQEIEDLKKSIRRFGIVDPIIVNTHPKRKNIIIGGHFRARVCKELGIKEIPVVYISIADIKKEKELNLRLNKNLGRFDLDGLAKFEESMLEDVGFTVAELEEIFDLKAQKEGAEVEFTKELLLEHNYVVLYFDNPFDWQVAIEKFGLKKVKDLILRKGQPTGIGRVVNGKEYLNKMR